MLEDAIDEAIIDQGFEIARCDDALRFDVQDLTDRIIRAVRAEERDDD